VAKKHPAISSQAIERQKDEVLLWRLSRRSRRSVLVLLLLLLLL
jgi:hypothetical protein